VVSTSERAPPADLAMLRWFGVFIGVPGTAWGGLFLSGAVAAALGVWEYYVAAVLMPVAGLSYAWLMAPTHKRVTCLLYALVGIGLACEFACPAWFPEGHPRAYERTYVPFAVTLATTGVCLSLLLFLPSRRRSH
jgi:hypothetical protein